MNEKKESFFSPLRTPLSNWYTDSENVIFIKIIANGRKILIDNSMKSLKFCCINFKRVMKWKLIILVWKILLKIILFYLKKSYIISPSLAAWLCSSLNATSVVNWIEWKYNVRKYFYSMIYTKRSERRKNLKTNIINGIKLHRMMKARVKIPFKFH